MEKIYRIILIVKNNSNYTRLDFKGWEDVVDECLEKDYITRGWDSKLELTERGCRFIMKYEMILSLFDKPEFFMQL